MLSTNDFTNMLLPVFSHWILWLVFLVVIIIISFLYALPYLKKPKKEFSGRHIGIPITNVICLYIFTKLLEGVLYSGSILKLDASINTYMQALPSSGITSIARFITNFGGTTLITIFFVLALTILLFKKRWRYALLSTVAILGALGLQLGIKSLVHRVRPENIVETNFSFPSGHAIMAIVFVSLLIYSFKDDFKNKTTKHFLIIVFSVFFVAVGISRIILHVHWFSDVLAGMSLGLFWFMTIVLIERSITGAVRAVRIETKEAAEKPIEKEIEKAVKKIVPKK